jgi:hypothetical protein
MADQSSDDASHTDDLQFDEADYSSGGEAGRCCAVCKMGIASAYYELSGQIICEGCRRGIEARLTGGSKATRFLRALVFGTGAGVAGFAVYFGVMKLAHLEIGLISILVGYLVGKAVRRGSEYRGGWVYQAMAAFLTYTAIGASYSAALLPQLLETARPKRPQPAAAPGDPVASPAAKPAAPAGGSRLVVLAIQGGVLLALIYALPILLGIHQPLGLLIVAFALWQAWKMNARPRLVFHGPFRIGPTGGSVPHGMPNHA